MVQKNLFDILNEENKRFEKLGDVVMVGDFNARTGQTNDFIQPDSFLEELFDCPLANYGKSLPTQISEGSIVNKRGNELLDFCKTN